MILAKIDINTVFFSYRGLGLDENEGQVIEGMLPMDVDVLIRALKRSGFGIRSNKPLGLPLPCPLGTFLNSSLIGVQRCIKCPPGNILLFVFTTCALDFMPCGIQNLQLEAILTQTLIGCSVALL